MAQAPGSSGSIPPKVFDPASGSNPNAENEGAAATAAVARRTLAGAPEEQQVGGAGRAPVNRELTNALLEAASQGDAETIRALLREGADPNAAEEEEGSTSLMWAARGGYAKAIRALLEGGANPNVVAEDGSTALMWAVHVKNDEGVRALLEGGAKPNVVAEDGSTALFWAAVEGNVALVEALLEGGADLNAVEEEEGSTSLMRAADAGHATVVEMLLKWGADPHVANKAGSTAIQMVEGATSETGRQIHAMLLRAEKEWKRQRNVAALFATLVPGEGPPMLD